MILPMHLQDSVTSLHALAKRASKSFERLGIETIEDLLLYTPSRYEDRRTVVQILETQDGQSATVLVTIDMVQTKKSFHRRLLITEVLAHDETGNLRLIWFGNRYIGKQLERGMKIFVSGKVTTDGFGYAMKSPEIEKVKEGDVTRTATIVPMYEVTAGITSRMIRFLIQRVFKEDLIIPDYLPDETKQRFSLIDRTTALRAIHLPNTEEDLQKARTRFAFDEIIIMQLFSLETKRDLEKSPAYIIPIRDNVLRGIVASFGFTLTDDQKKAIWAVCKDMEKGVPMNRLVQGDVGSGKTAVAAVVCGHVAQQGYQTVLMAPTDLLAQQHALSLEKMIASYATIGLYTSSVRKILENGAWKEYPKKEFLLKVSEGKVGVIVGTHALLYEPVSFPHLALAVVDEQHRFGVEQRKKLKERTTVAEVPHFLSLTATPIPRTISLTMFGELSLSIIAQKPSSRKPIITKVVAMHAREKAYEFIRGEISRGKQVFVVCPRIDEDEESQDLPSVEKIYEKLSGEVFSRCRVEKITGKMKQKEKDEVMGRMKRGEVDVLVSTTVIEVGIDIPNATVMMIEGAERFGLAQLHQLRGRVGRGGDQSYCFVFVSPHAAVSDRLLFFADNTDGFALAEYDFQVRGGGDRYGVVQSGFVDTRVADVTDAKFLQVVKNEAERLLHLDQTHEKFVTLWEKVAKYKVKTLHLE